MKSQMDIVINLKEISDQLRQIACHHNCPDRISDKIFCTATEVRIISDKLQSEINEQLDQITEELSNEKK